VQQSLVVARDPRIAATDGDLARQLELARQIQSERVRVAEALREAEGIRRKIASLPKADGAVRQTLAAFSRALEDAAGPPADSEELFEETEASPTNLRRIAARLARYERTVESADAAPTPDAESALAQRREEATAGLAHWRGFLEKELPAVNSALRAARMPVLATN
jgi:hypothetical protein